MKNLIIRGLLCSLLLNLNLFATDFHFIDDLRIAVLSYEKVDVVLDENKMLSCKSFRSRVKQLENLDVEVANISTEFETLDDFFYKKTLATYLIDILKDKYLNYFNENMVSFKLSGSFRPERIYFLFIGGSAYFYFPNGNKDFPVTTVILRKVSNFDLCLSRKLALYEIANCNAQGLSDLKLCDNANISKFIIDIPEKHIDQNPGVVLGGVQ